MTSDLKAFQAWAAAIRGQEQTKNHQPLATMQISHPGRQSPLACTRYQATPLAPTSGAQARLILRGSFGHLLGRLLIRPARAADDLPLLVQQFATTAQRAEQVGFDGVEIHAAHGNLLSQFVSRTANLRTDAYGQDAAGRRLLLLQVIAAI